MFIPVLFMGGILGRLFREFSVVICVAILISGFVSVTLTPMLCSRFLSPPHERKRSRFYILTERFFDGMLRVYERSLSMALRYRPVTMAISLVILIATGYLFMVVPKGFIPSEDADQIFMVTEAAQGASFEEVERSQKMLAAIVHANPNVTTFMSSIGGGSSSVSLGGPNFGRIFMHLKPRKMRTMGVDEVMAEMRPKLAVVPGMRAFMQHPPTIRIGGTLSKSLYQFTLQGTSNEELFRSAQIFEKQMAAVPGLQDVTSDLQIKNPQVNVEINRDQASALGITAFQVEDALASAYGSRQASTSATTHSTWCRWPTAGSRTPASSSRSV